MSWPGQGVNDTLLSSQGKHLEGDSGDFGSPPLVLADTGWVPRVTVETPGPHVGKLKTAELPWQVSLVARVPEVCMPFPGKSFGHVSEGTPSITCGLWEDAIQQLVFEL